MGTQFRPKSRRERPQSLQKFQGVKRLDRRRLGLKAIVAHGEAGSVKESLVPEERRRLQTLLADYDPEDIYNADETGLFYQMTPTRFLSTTNRPGVKKAKARFTALLTSNATGTRLLKIWIKETTIFPKNRPWPGFYSSCHLQTQFEGMDDISGVEGVYAMVG